MGRVIFPYIGGEEGQQKIQVIIRITDSLINFGERAV